MKELNILELRKLYKNDMVFLTAHCALRLEQRSITEDDIEFALNNGEIIEQYPNDYPWPSCLILGYSNNRPLHICMGSNEDAAKLITAYWPDSDKWSADFKQRKETES